MVSALASKKIKTGSLSGAILDLLFLNLNHCLTDSLKTGLRLFADDTLLRCIVDNSLNELKLKTGLRLFANDTLLRCTVDNSLNELKYDLKFMYY